MIRPPILPAHINDTIKAIAQLHAAHRDQATPFQRSIEKLITNAGKPEFVVVLSVLVAGWIIGNLLLMASGIAALDAPPFSWLQGALSLGTVYMTIFILAAQRRDDELASHREQLTLELAILSEQKAAKIIELLEELRRDHPNIQNRFDAEALALSTPAEPQAVLDAIKATHEEFLEEAAPQAPLPEPHR